MSNSQTFIVLSTDPETIFVPSGENATERTWALWALAFSALSSKVAAREGRNGRFWPRKGDVGFHNTPPSQTLMVLSLDPDTIVVPSGENTTELMKLLWALVFSATKARDEASARKQGSVKWQLGAWQLETATHPKL